MKTKYDSFHFLLVLFVVMLCAGTARAQNFQWKAPVKPVYSNGFYKIFLPPNATGRMQPDFSDIRLYDKDGGEVPYFFFNARKISHSETRHALDIREKSHKLRKGYTRILLHNEEVTAINNICFQVGREVDEAWVKVSASNNLKQWVIIKDDSPYLAKDTPNSTKPEIRITDIPPSEYRYYELRIYDKENHTIQPERVYFYDMKIQNIDYAQVPEPEINQYETQSGRLSVVKIRFDQRHYLDKLEFAIEGPKYYLRKAAINNSIPIAEKKFNIEYYEQMNEKFEISSEQDNVLNLMNYRAKELELVIENKDSKPLRIQDVKAYQVKKFLIARLRQNERYTIYFGDEGIDDPVYDLKYFRDSIQDDLPRAEIKHILSVRRSETRVEPLFNIEPFYLWLGIGIFLLFMILIALKILRDMQKEKQKEGNNAG